MAAPNISLTLQALMLLGLALGYVSMKRKRLIPHSYTMFVLYVAHVLSFLIFMRAPAISILTNIATTNLWYITAVHGVIGTLVLALSTYIMLRWRFQRPSARCYKMRREMKILAILWVAETLVGALVYYLIYLQ